MIFSGDPSNIIFPPFSPPTGPKSIIWSEVLIISRLCSITTTVLFHHLLMHEEYSVIFLHPQNEVL